MISRITVSGITIAKNLRNVINELSWKKLIEIVSAKIKRSIAEMVLAIAVSANEYLNEDFIFSGWFFTLKRGIYLAGVWQWKAWDI